MSNALHVHAAGTSCTYSPSESGPRHTVTCRRCLASLAKRDRAFQRKARGWFSDHHWVWREWSFVGLRDHRMTLEAARAIAREEGRAL